MLVVLKASPFGVGDQLTSVEMNILNDEIAHALDGINGGTYALTANLNLSSTTFGLQLGKLTLNTGANLLFNSSNTITGSPAWSGTPSFIGALSVNGITIASSGGPGGTGTLTIGSGAVIYLPTGGTLTVDAGATTTFTNNPTFAAGHTVTFAGTVHFDGTAEVTSGHLLAVDAGATLTLNGNGVVGGTGTLAFGSGTLLNVGSGAIQHIQSGGQLLLDAGSLATVSGPFGFASGATLSVAAGVAFNLAGVMAPTGAGHVRLRVKDDASLDANITLGINDADLFWLASPSGAWTWTLSNTGAARGDVMHFAIVTGANSVLVRNAVFVAMATLSHGANSSSVSVYFDGTNWQRTFIGTG